MQVWKGIPWGVLAVLFLCSLHFIKHLHNNIYASVIRPIFTFSLLYDQILFQIFWHLDKSLPHWCFVRNWQRHICPPYSTSNVYENLTDLVTRLVDMWKYQSKNLKLKTSCTVVTKLWPHSGVHRVRQTLIQTLHIILYSQNYRR